MKMVGHHRHIISMVSCCTRGNDVCLIVEFAEHGDLLNFLKDKRNKVCSYFLFFSLAQYTAPKQCYRAG